MKVIYEFHPDDDKNNDRYELSLLRMAASMDSALHDIDNIRRSLYKGYKYYDPESEDDENSDYSKINVELLLEDLCSAIEASKIFDREE